MGRDGAGAGAGAGVDVWRILHAACCMLHAACFMLHDICCVLYDERVEFGLVAGCGLGLAMTKGSIEPFLELVWL